MNLVINSIYNRIEKSSKGDSVHAGSPFLFGERIKYA